MNKWHARFIDLARFISRWSKDPSTKVGAVLVRGKRILGVGFNGFPAGVEDDPYVLDNREIKNARTLHAEVNAILCSRDIDLHGAEIYITHPPCSQCAAMIVQSGIKHVHYPAPSAMFMARWGASTEIARSLFKESGVHLNEWQETADE